MITARDRSGLIHDIAAVVSEAGVNMTSVNSHVSSGREQAIITVTLEVEDLNQMQRVLNRLGKVKGVISVERNLGQRRRWRKRGNGGKRRRRGKRRWWRREAAGKETVAEE